MSVLGETDGEASFTGDASPSDPLAIWLEAPDALSAQMARGARPFEPGFDLRAVGYAYIQSDRLAAAVVNRDGRLLYGNASFLASVGQDAVDPAAIAEALAGGRRLVAASISAIGPVTIAYGPIEIARRWRLPPDVAEALDRPGGVAALLAVTTTGALEALTDACESFGLTTAETRIITGLILSGNVRDAARRAEVRYDTARKVVFTVMRRLGINRQSALIERLVKLSLGIWPTGREGDAVLADTWGLTPRQGALAYRLSVGMSRAECARAVGVSDAVAKKELAAAFTTLGVDTASGLTRFVTEARALSLLTDALDGDEIEGQDALEPLRIVLRPGGGQVAFSDYGPRTGVPVLVLHSSSSSRPVPRRLVRALQTEGFRPVAIDRPGFGLTDPRPDHRQTDPFDAACADVALVCETLQIDALHVIARGGAQVALALARLRPDLLRRVLLVNPDPPTRPHDARNGVFAAVKQLYATFPDLIERFATTLARHVSLDRARQVIDRLTDGSKVDQQAMMDPLNYGDFVRSIRMFTTGRVAGYVAEQIAMTRSDPAPFKTSSDWRVYLGAEDSLHDPRVTEAYWRGILPAASITIFGDGGRFIAMTHPAEIVRGLG
ncbi:MAG: alpha/beta fold hydrolase [Caulobacter sp.]|nr:alpha/beta fold hydrolase [Caulobacter sp.]